MRVQDVSFGVQPTKLLGFGSTTAVCFYCVDCLTRLQVHKELEIQSVKENGSALQYPFHNHFRINLMVNTKPDSRAANRGLRGPTPRLQPQPLPGAGALGWEALPAVAPSPWPWTALPEANLLYRPAGPRLLRRARSSTALCPASASSYDVRGAEWLAHGRNADSNPQVTRGSTAASGEREKGTAAPKLSTGLRWFHLRTWRFTFLKLKDDSALEKLHQCPERAREPAVPHAFGPSEDLKDHPNSSSAASSPVVLTGTPALSPGALLLHAALKTPSGNTNSRFL